MNEDFPSRVKTYPSVCSRRLATPVTPTVIFATSFNPEYVVAPEANCATAINAQKARNNFETSCMSVVLGARKKSEVYDDVGDVKNVTQELHIR